MSEAHNPTPGRDHGARPTSRPWTPPTSRASRRRSATRSSPSRPPSGGHVGPNLGVVELTIALHRVFDTPTDSFVFDVAHQGYVHKLLTGRGGEFFRKLRQTGGASGFLYRAESAHDSFGAGHAGTALSAALGMATARDLRGHQRARRRRLRRRRLHLRHHARGAEQRRHLAPSG